MSPPLAQALTWLGAGRDLSEAETCATVSAIMSGAEPDGGIAAFLTALHVRGETEEELAGAVRAVREHIEGWEDEGLRKHLLDTCGTGGDGANTVNVSTATAIVAAACGVPVAKHGNRSASGNSGSAEVLAELGIGIDPPPGILRRCLTELGITFLFAPRFHPAMRFAAPVRHLLPFRTLFNLVGPLANPAQPAFQLVGVPDERQADLIAQVLVRLGTVCSAVVTGSDGLDEVTLGGETRVCWVESGRVRHDSWTPEDFGLPRTDPGALRVTGPAESAARLRGMLAGEVGPVRHSVLANTAAALLVAGRVAHLPAGVERAAEAIDSSAAARLLERWGCLSRSEGSAGMRNDSCPTDETRYRTTNS
jgi:anthranilate phosphoribosyltransferase